MSALNKDAILNLIDSESYHHFEGTTVVTCLLTLKNGGHVLGYAMCVNSDDLDFNIGMSVARDKAIDQIWELEGYALKTRG